MKMQTQKFVIKTIQIYHVLILSYLIIHRFNNIYLIHFYLIFVNIYNKVLIFIKLYIYIYVVNSKVQ